MEEAVTALDKVLHLATLVEADLARFERESGLTRSRIHLLWILGVTGPTTQQTLAGALGVTPRNVTGLVDALVASRHVNRELHPSDRRATLVTPTAAGDATIRQLVDSRENLARELFGEVPAERLASFVATLDDTIATLARLIEETS